jgi:hypothetical protein
MVKNAHPMHPHNMKERNKIWPFFFFTIINLPHSLIKGACIRTEIVITLQFDLAFASWIFLFIVEGLGCVLEQKLEHSIFLLQIQNWLTKIWKNSLVFQNHKIGFFFKIVNLEYNLWKIGKTCQYFETTNLGNFLKDIHRNFWFFWEVGKLCQYLKPQKWIIFFLILKNCKNTFWILENFTNHLKLNN